MFFFHFSISHQFKTHSKHSRWLSFCSYLIIYILLQLLTGLATRILTHSHTPISMFIQQVFGAGSSSTCLRTIHPLAKNLWRHTPSTIFWFRKLHITNVNGINVNVYMAVFQLPIYNIYNIESRLFYNSLINGKINATQTNIEE